jgi:RHS repeat-associated protein
VVTVPCHLSWTPWASSTSPPPVRIGHLSPADRLETPQPHYDRNQQYSIVGLTNAAGTLVAYGTLGIYDPSGTVRSSSTYANRYTYTGREHDAELNLYHFRARWYDPATGGFVSRDPLGYIDGMSLYRGYFGVHKRDPSGRACEVQFDCVLIKEATVKIGFDLDCFYECTENKKGAPRQVTPLNGIGPIESDCEWLRGIETIRIVESKRVSGTSFFGAIGWCSDCEREYSSKYWIVPGTRLPSCSPSECRKACDHGKKAFDKFCRGNFASTELCKLLTATFTVHACHATCDAICKGQEAIDRYKTPGKPSSTGTNK